MNMQRFKKHIHLINNQQGMSLVEIIVAIGILSIGLLGYMTYNSMLAKAEKEVSQSITSTRVLNTIINDLKTDNRFIIPTDESPADTLFDNPLVSAERCYNSQGGRIFLPADDGTEGFADTLNTFYLKECLYRVKFYKTKVNHANSTVKTRIPMSQFHIKVRYYQGIGEQRREVYASASPFVVNAAQY